MSNTTSTLPTVTSGPWNLTATNTTCTFYDLLTSGWIAGGTHRETEEAAAARMNMRQALVRQDLKAAYFWMYDLVSRVASTGQTAAA